jgi:hypothetical protein
MFMAIGVLEAFQRAERVLGRVSAEELVAFAAQEFGVRLDPRFFPVFRATLTARASIPPGDSAGRGSLPEKAD